MLHRFLRPTGNKINIKNSLFDKDIFRPFNIRFFQSGTAALAAVILAIKKTQSKSHVEILLPAYTCPDIISAIVFAHATPILVDLSPDSPQMSLNSLQEKISANTIAIIAINFLGIPENISKLRKICDKNNLTLIEDSAQAVPNDSFASYWNGDFIILSFGRGKPLNLLGGGAVLAKPETRYSNNLHTLDIKRSSNKQSILYNLKIIIYNILIQPFFYSLLLKFPGFHIGRTIFKPLLEINALHEHTLNKITSNFNHYVKENRSGNVIHKHLSTINNDLVIDLASKYDSVGNLLRYPILIKDPNLQKLVLEKYKNKGLSNMYAKELNQIDGTQNLLNRTEKYPNAKNFANSLITIPIHSDFYEKDIIEIVDFIKRY